MPELPEVETVCRGLNEIISPEEHTIKKIVLGDKSLRQEFRRSLIRKAHGQKIIGIHRKAKYLLFELETHYLISHLGMTGSWRIEEKESSHDHVRIFLEDKRVLSYRDPRRFGQFDIIKKADLNDDKRFSHLGPDPVKDEGFSGEMLYRKSRNRNITVKVFIMNQETVVGVGNIYASEALYLAGIKPQKKCSKISLKDYERLAEAIKETLLEAIFCGGSTISDFRQAGGSEGYFQNLFFVYGKDKEECFYCSKMIRSEVIGGRNSFWCNHCQK